MTEKPKYNIVCVDESLSALKKDQLEEVLKRIPLSIEIRKGHNLSILPHISYISESKSEDPVLNVEHGAQLIVLRPQSGMRLYDACFYGKRSNFVPSRVMDECTGGGACCSYSFNTKKLGLSYDKDLMLDIHKLGWKKQSFKYFFS